MALCAYSPQSQRHLFGDGATARKAWETAKAMIEEMGYHRRDGEVAEIEQQLNAD